MSLLTGLDDAFRKILDTNTAGDPDRDGVLWTNLSRSQFPHVTRACQGLLLTSLEVAVAAMQKTATKKGLRTTDHVMPDDYPR